MNSGGMIIREEEPRNVEFPFDRLDTYLTPVESFYIRSHFRAPTLQSDSYRLRVAGAVKNPFAITYEWTGVPLATLLGRAGLTSKACEVVLEGADRGVPTEGPKPSEPISFSRSVPLDKALDDVLIAYLMNGVHLPPEHGSPVRAIVPGHYAMASVKWLTHVCVLEEKFQGYWQTTDYGYWDELDGIPVRRPLSELKVKSAIARPGTLELVPKGQMYTVNDTIAT